MKCIFSGLILLSVVASGFAQEWAKAKLETSLRHQEWVDLKVGERTSKVFVVYPEVKEKAPVFVLIHEIMGMTDWVMLIADEIAATGFIVVAPDFLSGMGPDGGRTSSFSDLGKIREAISGLPPSQVTADLNAATDYAKKISSANGKVAVGGFCWGGTQTFRFATERPDIDAALVFYGTAPDSEDAIKKIKAPVFGFYGENDNRINATLEGTKKLMDANGKKFDQVIYKGAGHGFMRSGAQPDALEDNKLGRESGFKRLVEILKGLSLLRYLLFFQGR